MIVACLVEIDELINVSAAPVRVAIDAVPNVVTPVTPSVPEHNAFAREDRPVTPSVPEQEAFARDVRPVTPNVPEHAAFVREVIPVTPSVPEHEAFTRDVRPVTLSVPEHDAFAREVIPVTPSVPEHEAFASVESPVTAIVELNVEEPDTRVPIVAELAFRDVAVVAWRDAVDPVATTKLLTTVVVVGETVKRG